MEVRDEVVVPCVPDEVAPWIENLEAYPEWMGLVHRARRLPGDEAAWSIDLRARIGPLARSKRLRMVRTVLERPGTVRFERVELDGRRHGRWELAVEYGTAGPDTTRVAVDLRYDGSFWTAGVLEHILHDEIDRAKVRLVELVREGRRPGETDATGGTTR